MAKKSSTEISRGYVLVDLDTGFLTDYLHFSG